MTFLRGASLTTITTLGYAESSDLGPTAGNGFRTRWPDDLAALQQVGITDVQITLDWARLQPKPGTIDDDWAEWFEQVLQASHAIGLRPWACLHDGSIPRWFDNDGGFDDDDAFTRWWPRWVERAADRFGDMVGGWIPFSCMPSGTPEQPWIDTWGILAGGPPVIAAIELASHTGSVDRIAQRANLIGAVPTIEWRDDTIADTDRIQERVDRWGAELRDTADDIDTGLAIVGFGEGQADPDVAGTLAAAWRSMLDSALDDGVPIEVVFVEPAITGPDSSPGLLDAGRASTPTSDAFLAG